MKAGKPGAGDVSTEEQLLEETVAYRKNVTGIAHTIFISPKGNMRHAARVTIAINPPVSVDPRAGTASIAVADGAVTAGDVPLGLLDQVRRFIVLNREVLLEYWNYKIDTVELRQRLRSIAPWNRSPD